ncbi:hypothetical protein ACIHFD_18320 [Nonomuraea sp. NPDC051941]|uniref:hypothetical protein n=1 Tax=Nonomuraea sp. NPDC051941 TaxID=3364373 RepID=UPI0037C57769
MTADVAAAVQEFVDTCAAVAVLADHRPPHLLMDDYRRTRWSGDHASPAQRPIRALGQAVDEGGSS